ncbi:MAG: LTA synthase family protein [Clostridia bacterium]|nr:LTA synthase family protein [Clostridia bacterium]
MNINKIKESVKGFVCGKLPRFFKQSVPEYFKNNFEITATKPSKITGAVLCLACLLLVIFSINTYNTLSISTRWIIMALDLALPFVIAAVTIFRINIKHNLTKQILGFVILLLMPFVTTTITECLNGVFVGDMVSLGIFGNYIIILVFYFIVFAISGNFAITYTSVNLIIMCLAVAHHYVMEFRGTPFQPMDFLSIGTAAGVAGTYNFAPNYKLITAAFIFIIVLVITLKMRTPKFNLATAIVSRSFMATFSAVLLILFYGTSIFADLGIKPDFWNQARGYKNSGFVYNFFVNTKYLFMSEPNDYDPDKIKDYIDQTVDPNENKDPNKVRPNVICIMNESLSDLRVLGNLETNLDYMPFMNSLTENTVKGNLYVPVIGAGTSNTEFEFLTGHSTHFLPSGSNAYMLYVKNPMASLVSTMKAQSYSAWAFHPYLANGWNRPTVYSNFGFNKFTALEDIFDMSLWERYQANGNDANYLQSLVDLNYPGSNMLLRQYISDDYNFDLLIEDYENRDKSQPYFTFNVTMQNHGGYSMSCVNFNEAIYATSTSKAYNRANKYLSLVRATDTAFKELIEYFSKVKEPTIICMFGDHQPNVETNFVAEVMGVKDINNLSIEDEQKRYTTPFFIWANYDIEEKMIPRLSVNYLSSLVLQTAGLELTEYNKYLLKLSETLPVINTAGYIDAEGNYYKWSDTSPYTDILKEYEKIQYNCIFDQKNIDTEVFFLSGYQHTATDLSRKE